MSYTGTYKFNPKTGKVEKISDQSRTTRLFDVFVPKGGYYSENLGGFVDSKSTKRRILDRRGWVENA